MGVLSAHTRLGKVSLRTAERDKLRARLDIESVLAGVDWSTPAMPPHAVLVVRRMVADEARRDGQSSYAKLGDRVTLAFRRAASSARRPWVAPDAASADAVWFADDAELVACLVRDWLRGTVHDRWWWRTVLAASPVATWIRQHVLVRGDVLVPALSQLTPSGDAVKWMAHLDDSDAARAVDAIVCAYAVPYAAIGVSASAWREHDAGAVRLNNDAVPQATPASHELIARLLDVVPELRSSRLRVTQQRILTLALVATRDSGWLRTPEFASALQHLDLVETRAALVRHTSTVPPVAQSASSALTRVIELPDLHSSPHLATAHGTAERQSPLVSSPAVQAFDPRTTSSHADAARSEKNVPAPDSPETRLDASPASRLEATDPLAQRSDTNEAAHAVPPSLHERTIGLDEPSVAAPPLSVVETSFGGIFYLLNALLALELYGDFTKPRTLGIALSPWDLLALVGRAWFGDAFVRDPLWDVLAALAGRSPADEPGRDFVAPRSWLVEEAWLAPWGDTASLRVYATRSRVRVMHDAGFPLFDTGATRPRTRTARWIAALTAYLQARLVRALGIRSPIDARELACRRDARVVITASTVDVHLTLAQLPLPVRFAGLDRDPGWIPAAGRSVTFHFA